jgi:hypothetical protein
MDIPAPLGEAFMAGVQRLLATSAAADAPGSLVPRAFREAPEGVIDPE